MLSPMSSSAAVFRRALPGAQGSDKVADVLGKDGRVVYCGGLETQPQVLFMVFTEVLNFELFASA